MSNTFIPYVPAVSAGRQLAEEVEDGVKNIFDNPDFKSDLKRTRIQLREHLTLDDAHKIMVYVRYFRCRARGKQDPYLALLCEWITTRMEDRCDFSEVAAKYFPTGLSIVCGGTWWTLEEQSQWEQANTDQRHITRQATGSQKRPQTPDHSSTSAQLLKRPRRSVAVEVKARKRRATTAAHDKAARKPDSEFYRRPRNPSKSRAGRPPNIFAGYDILNMPMAEAVATFGKKYPHYIMLKRGDKCNYCRRHSLPICMRETHRAACVMCRNKHYHCELKGVKPGPPNGVPQKAIETPSSSRVKGKAQTGEAKGKGRAQSNQDDECYAELDEEYEDGDEEEGYEEENGNTASVAQQEGLGPIPNAEIPFITTLDDTPWPPMSPSDSSMNMFGIAGDELGVLEPRIGPAMSSTSITPSIPPPSVPTSPGATEDSLTSDGPSRPLHHIKPMGNEKPRKTVYDVLLAPTADANAPLPSAQAHQGFTLLKLDAEAVQKHWLANQKWLRNPDAILTTKRGEELELCRAQVRALYGRYEDICEQAKWRLGSGDAEVRVGALFEP